MPTSRDFDGDGLDDLAAIVGERLLVFRGDRTDVIERVGTEIDRGFSVPNPMTFASDSNGDGRAELIVSQTAVGVFFGRSPPERHRADWLYGAAGAVASCDINGDGFSDVLVGEPIYGIGVRAFFGSPAGLPAEPDVEKEMPAMQGTAFFEVFACADLDRDGFDDLAMGNFLLDTPNPAVFDSEVNIYRGGVQPFREKLTIPAPTNAKLFGGSLTTGDFNGDGAIDLAVGAALQGDVGFEIFVYDGPIMRKPTPHALEKIDSSGIYPVPSMIAADVNGDRFTDLVVSNGDRPGIDVHFGGRDGLQERPGQGRASDVALSWLGRGGDLNGDGIEEITGVGFQAVRVFSGSLNGLRGDPVRVDIADAIFPEVAR